MTARQRTAVGLLVSAIVLGVIGGFASVAFVKLLLYLRERFLRMPNSTLWLQPVAGGLTVGILGFFMPQVLGVGYDQVERVLNGDVILKTVLILAALKIIATAVAYCVVEGVEAVGHRVVHGGERHLRPCRCPCPP